jgi:predicted GTPase
MRPSQPVFVIVGNKVDLAAQRQVQFDDGDELAKHYSVAYYETSARTGQGIDDLFGHVCRIAIAIRTRKAAESVVTAPSVDLSKPAAPSRPDKNRGAVKSSDFTIGRPLSVPRR